MIAASDIANRRTLQNNAVAGLATPPAAGPTREAAAQTSVPDAGKQDPHAKAAATGWTFSGKPGLVVMHMQESIIGDPREGNTPQGTDFRALATRTVRDSGMIDRTRDLLAAFRAKGLPIVYVNAVMGDGGLNKQIPQYGRLFNMIRQAPPYLHDRETAATVIPELGRNPEEPVLVNWLLGAFSYSGLDTWLKVNGVSTVVMAGFATHSVVLNAVVQACDLWYSVVIPRDAVASFLPDLSEKMLNELFPFYAQVTDTSDVIAHL